MEFNNQLAIYLQIVERIYEDILLGKLKEGERMPSVREMAVNTEVNPNTVMRSYAYLQEKEIIFNKRGVGYFICDMVFNKIQNMKKEEFLEQELPKFFKSMQLLNIDIKDLEKQFEVYPEIRKCFL